MKTWQRYTVALALLGALAVGQARAQYTNYWTNSASGTWNWSTAGNWSSNSVPAEPTTRVIWTNNASTAYTVQFTGYSTSSVVRVTSDKVTFDLNGQFWYAPDTGAAADYSGSNPEVSPWFGGGVGETCTVVFSSSAAGTNTVKLNSGLQHGWRVGNGTFASTLMITTNLGYGVTVIVPPSGGPYGGNVIIRGPGSELRNPAGNYAGFAGNVLVVDGGYLNYGIPYSTSVNGGAGAGITVDNARMTLSADYIGNVSAGRITLTNNAVWWSGRTMQVGYNLASGSLVIDHSTLYGQGLTIGYANGKGDVTVRNGGTMILSNGLLFVSDAHPVGTTNTLVLQNGTIELGRTSLDGVITNRGLMRAAGAIVGKGAGRALVRNEHTLDIGSSIGTLALTNANLQLAAGSRTLFEFSETGLDQILITGGSASLLGSNVFTLVGAAPGLIPGVKWGLGTYDFVVGSNLTWNPQYANLTNILSGYSLVQGVDYSFGVVGLENGLQALRLSFVPEPSTALLLIGGGLMLYQMRKRS
jgi:hypothetical protein